MPSSSSTPSTAPTVRPLIPLTATELRRTTYPVEIRPGRSVSVRRGSMLTLLFAGKIPMPLLGAFAQVQRGVTQTDLFELPDDDRANMIAVLRWYACAIVAAPVLVMAEDGDPSHVPVVDALTIEELFILSNAEPPADVIEDPDAPVPVVTEDDLARFSGSGPRDAAGPAPHPGQDVSPAAVGVGVPAVDIVHG